MTLKLFNTLGRKIEDFMPIIPNEAGLYTCGPTVYNFAHIGNLRTYLFEDILRRTLEYLGYSVNQVMNVTDVGHLTDDADQGEDKMVKSAREQGRSVWDIAEFYSEAFFKDMELLNIFKPTIICKATEHITEMIELIKRIEDNGFTYSAGGNLYFDIGKAKDYGKLALLNLQELKAGARIEVDKNKKMSHDFVLWFTRSKFEHQAMMWDSPWGRGYPGWHVECSAMSIKYLGEQFDIHCGGVDHISVHHTNEIAQSEAATGKKWVNHWLHGEFLVLNKEKMAKSSGKFLTLAALLEQGFKPLDYRYFCLGAHYRSQLQFSFEGLEGAKSARANMAARLIHLQGEVEESGAEPGETVPGEKKGAEAEEYLTAFKKNICDDLNTPRALANFWGLLKDNGIQAAEKLKILYEMDRVLGLDIAKCKLQDEEIDEQIEMLIKERELARAGKDFQRADKIRAELNGRGIILRDTHSGTVWRKKKTW